MRNLIALILFSPLFAFAQVNCNTYKYGGNEVCYEACSKYDQATEYYQFDMRCIRLLEEAVELCPNFAEAYYELGVVYLKAGNFIEWNKFINKAVELKPTEFLGLRASGHGKQFADYEQAIADINELERLVDYDMGTINDGSSHLEAYRALCYKILGRHHESIEAYEQFMKNKPEAIGFRDYLNLGKTYLDVGSYDEAIRCFEKQKEYEDFADCYYYAALAHKAKGQMKQYLIELDRSMVEFQRGNEMWNPFNPLEDEIYIGDIERELAEAEQYR